MRPFFESASILRVQLSFGKSTTLVTVSVETVLLFSSCKTTFFGFEFIQGSYRRNHRLHKY